MNHVAFSRISMRHGPGTGRAASEQGPIRSPNSREEVPKGRPSSGEREERTGPGREVAGMGEMPLHWCSPSRPSSDRGRW